MKYYSTNKNTQKVSLEEAVTKGLASDNGLFMPDLIKALPASFYNDLPNKTLQEISYAVADCFFGEDVEAEKLKDIVYDTMNFDIPLVEVEENIYSLELFHGPTLAFKDVGARFMARLLGYFIGDGNGETVNVLVATSGDTGSAVANGFLNVPGIKVYVLYPKGLVSRIQESQFVTLGANITAIEVDGTFDDCQRLVKSAFLDDELTDKLILTSANSINVARFLPQSFYYFWAVAQLMKKGITKNIVCSVPSGNFGNITAGLFGHRMGLPIHRFVAGNNRNDIFYNYLVTGKYQPKSSVATIANAMDVGDPSNFARVLDLFGHDHKAISDLISGDRFEDEDIHSVMLETYQRTGYLLDPHGAIGYKSLKNSLEEDEVGFFIETAHPAKFCETVEGIINEDIEIPITLQEFMKGKRQTIAMTANFDDFKTFLLQK